MEGLVELRAAGTPEIVEKAAKMPDSELIVSKSEPDRACDKSVLNISRSHEGSYIDMLSSQNRPQLSGITLEEGNSEKAEAYAQPQGSAQVRRMQKCMIMSGRDTEVSGEEMQQLKSICKTLMYNKSLICSKVESLPVIAQACTLLEEYRQVLVNSLLQENCRPEEHLDRVSSLAAYQQAKIQRYNTLLKDIDHSMSSLYESKSMHLSYLSHAPHPQHVPQISQSLQGSGNSTAMRQRTWFVQDFERECESERGDERERDHEYSPRPCLRNKNNRIWQHRAMSNSDCEVKIGSIYVSVTTLLIGTFILSLATYHLFNAAIRLIWRRNA